MEIESMEKPTAGGRDNAIQGSWKNENVYAGKKGKRESSKKG